MINRRIRRVIGIPGRLFRYLLYLHFRFDKWHVNTRYDRKYPDDIIKYLNAKPVAKRTSVVEIGCGLGDILRNLKYSRRFGFDMDVNALKAAEFLSTATFTKASYRYFKFPESELTGKHDTIILVNWIHHVPSPVLKSSIEKYFTENLLPGGEIVIDTVSDHQYEINHSVDTLASGINCSVISIGKDLRGREVFALQKNLEFETQN